MIFKPGSHICNDKYRVEKLAGSGAFAEVYHVTHLRLRAPRAVKVLRMEMPGVGSSDFRSMRQRFEIETELGARRDHPNIIKVYDFEEYQDELYLVMEYAAGGSLADRLIERGPLNFDETIQMALDVCQGLEVIHNKLQVVHRDIKPSNMEASMDEGVPRSGKFELIMTISEGVWGCLLRARLAAQA